ncbi:alpha/beta hydrolase [Crossiella sp. CA198]|uniref:alpha/beta hydrolase n=1 Tax=Crossiella sp. CA198 TaxID=3455607 RepID=UPI003F8D5944
MPRARRWVALALGVLAGTGLITAPAGAEPEARPITWGDCAGFVGAPTGVAIECARLSVPRDYTRPWAERISIGVSRIKATDPARRRGVLLTNPGGPGADGMFAWTALWSGFPELAASYDLIGFAPRGTVNGTPIDCGGLVGPRTPAQPYAPERDPAANCAAGSGPLLRHISTENTARDMDQLRRALGERRINYWGASYGTYLGGVYAALFPRALDRAVLDSAIHPDWAWRRSRVAQAEAKEQRTNEMFDDIASRHPANGLGGTRAELLATWTRLRKWLQDNPIADPKQPGRFATGDTLFSATGFYVNYRRTWGVVERLLVELNRERTGTLLLEATRPFGAELPSGGGEHRPVNMTSVYLGVTCGEDRWPRDPAVYERDAAELERRFPLNGRYFMLVDLPCAFWPHRPSPQVRIAGHGLSTTPLVLQSRRDPATPYQGGVALAERLRGRLLSVAGGEHGPSMSGNICVAAAVTGYLRDGRLPPAGAECAESAAGPGPRLSPR